MGHVEWGDSQHTILIQAFDGVLRLFDNVPDIV